MRPIWAKLGSSWPKLSPSWTQVGILRRSCRHLAILARLGRVLEATWRQLERTSAVTGASWAVNPCVAGVKSRVKGAARRIARTPWEDEVFEEEESDEVLGALARPCHPVCDRGRRIKSHRAFRRAGIDGTGSVMIVTSFLS